jgi:hypothetical protein
MRQTKLLTIIAIATAGLLVAQKVGAQSATNINAPRGLAQIGALENTASGKMALARNLTITGAIQDGSAQQAILLSFSEQQQLALRDAFITDGNAYELTDGLGTELEKCLSFFDDLRNSARRKEASMGVCRQVSLASLGQVG